MSTANGSNYSDFDENELEYQRDKGRLDFEIITELADQVGLREYAKRALKDDVEEVRLAEYKNQFLEGDLESSEELTEADLEPSSSLDNDAVDEVRDRIKDLTQKYNSSQRREELVQRTYVLQDMIGAAGVEENPMERFRDSI